MNLLLLKHRQKKVPHQTKLLFAIFCRRNYFKVTFSIKKRDYEKKRIDSHEIAIQITSLQII
jgi:hypothetical protein